MSINENISEPQSPLVCQAHLVCHCTYCWTCFDHTVYYIACIVYWTQAGPEGSYNVPIITQGKTQDDYRGIPMLSKQLSAVTGLD